MSGVGASTMLALAFLLDALIGDPDWSFHPIRLIGATIKKGEIWLRRDLLSPMQEFVRGAGLVVVTVVLTYIGATFLLQFAEALSWWLGQAATILLGSFCLARRSLKEHAQAVRTPLQTGDLECARTMLARIVSRDTTGITEVEVVRGTIESIAENSSDGVIAPLFYLALGGVPLALAYKAVNTLDSMLGYRTEQYEYFGKAAARFDDAVNFIPARLTALALIGAAWIGQQFDYPFVANAAWRITWRDGAKHASPNAGYPEAALAGALGVQLGGSSRYFGEVIEKPTLGEARFPLTPSCITFSLVLLDLASLLALGAFCLGRVLV